MITSDSVPNLGGPADGEQPQKPETGQDLFRKFVNSLPSDLRPFKSGGAWTIVNGHTDDGRPVPYAVLGLSQANAVNCFFFDMDDLKTFMQGSLQAMQVLQNALNATGGIQIASPQDMEHVAKQSQPINWPPK